MTAGADVLQRLIRTIEAGAEHERYAIVFEQQSFPGDTLRADADYDPTARKLHAFSLIRRLETRGVDAILLPCFISQTFVGEIVPNVSTPIDPSRATPRRITNEFACNLTKGNAAPVYAA